MESKATTCGKCGRAVWVADINPHGVCILCEPSSAPESTAPSGPGGTREDE